ncbi:DNA circularization protein [Photorhabdus luminescens]|uniref:DNA circulation N-terminal domain-containing protein n=1 Tax=Photorhabdus luminescens subsp. mexicana TaxID=2100167 RepID=A0A4R4IRL2_PHOLU|nr:DNA circularization N-terminal domain-containing protein [Photorhabdus luminescens]TDB43314.1 hypothetical protein C5468_23685 [Photorhabdus luminescens subsp. mexicana]
MPLIKDAISSFLGKDQGWKWSEHLHPASFRGVPFAVVSGESVFGRRQAVHEYPYRDTAWIEDLGRSSRKITLRGFIIQDSKVYSAPDVITQRNNLVAACEEGANGTLIHPTLGELTVSVTESGLRVNESADNGRVFEFTLTVIESGLKVFAITNSTAADSKVNANWLRTATTTAAKFISMVKGEIRTVTQAVKTIKQTIGFWENMVKSSIDEVTNLSDMLNSTFGSKRYGRYSRGKIGGSVSGATGVVLRNNDSENYKKVVNEKMAGAVMGREAISKALSQLNNANSIEGLANGVQLVINVIINATGSTAEKVRVFENLASFKNTQYQQSSVDRDVAEATTLLLVVLSSGAMAKTASELIPANRDEAATIQRRVCESLDNAIIKAGDLAADDVFQALVQLRYEFVESFSLKDAKGRLTQFSLPSVLPVLTVANRIYQDAGRSDELVQAVSPIHPAFMPVKFKALKQ